MTAAELIERLEEAIEDAHNTAGDRADAIQAAAKARPSALDMATMGAAALDVVRDDLLDALTEIERWRLLGGDR